MKSVRPPVFYEKNHKTALILRTMASLILSLYRIDIPGSRSSIPYQTRWISNSFTCCWHQHCFYPTGWQSNSLVTNHIFKYLGKIGTLRCFSPGANSKSLPPWQSTHGTQWTIQILIAGGETQPCPGDPPNLPFSLQGIYNRWGGPGQPPAVG